MTIGERIKMLRERKNMTQQELAEAVGYSTASAVNKIEMGARDVKQNKIQAFADVLGVKPSYLFGDDEKEQQESSEPKFKVALLNGSLDISDEQWEEVYRFAKFITDKENKE